MCHHCHLKESVMREEKRELHKTMSPEHRDFLVRQEKAEVLHRARLHSCS